MLEINESDSKVLRRVYPLAHGRFCGQMLAEAENLLHDPERGFCERYLDLRDLIQFRDRQMTRLFDNPRRSTALPRGGGPPDGRGLLVREHGHPLDQRTPDKLELVRQRLAGSGDTAGHTTPRIFRQSLAAYSA